MFIEHDPSGRKRYYGLDTCLGRTGRITNELGTHAWLLVREEDPHGNSIQYAYHNDKFDGFGNPIERLTGNFDGDAIAPAEQRRRTGLEYENRTDTQWMIGLVTRVQKQGYSVDIDGNVDPDYVLEDGSLHRLKNPSLASSNSSR